MVAVVTRSAAASATIVVLTYFIVASLALYWPIGEMLVEAHPARQRGPPSRMLTRFGGGCREGSHFCGGSPVLARDDQNKSTDWVERARALAPMVEAAGARIETERRIVPDIVAALHEAGLFRMLLPVVLGGGAADIIAFNRVIETIAAADASTAWCLAQAVASTHAAGFLDPKIAREVFGAPNGAVAWGPPAGLAKAVVADGGYVVSGRWRFASGSEHCPWLGGHSVVFERDGKPRLDPHGRPVNRTMLFRKEQATMQDIWNVIGLRGTSSNEFEVRELFVPEAYTTWRDLPADRRENGPLYNIPMLTLYGIGFSGVALGLARASLDAFMTLAATKKPGGGLGSATLLRDNAVIQSRVAKANGRLNSARAYLTDMLRDIWATSADAGSFSLEQRAQLRVAITGAMDQASRVVDFAYHAAGTTAIFSGSAFERRFRDMHTATAQGQAHLSNFEAAGQALFGIEPSQRL
jgi:alkylation response protein AidB-like acyl-CoA dehydrogenase